MTYIVLHSDAIEKEGHVGESGLRWMQNVKRVWAKAGVRINGTEGEVVRQVSCGGGLPVQRWTSPCRNGIVICT